MKRNILIIFFIILSAVAVERILSNVSFFKDLELKTYDMRARFSTENNIFSKNKYSDKSIVIVGIDDYSLRKLSQKSSASWEKNVWLKVINFIEKGRPKVVMFDMVFQKAVDKPWYDETFADTLKKYDNTVLGTYLDEPLLKDNNFTKKIKINSNNYIPTMSSLNVSIDSKKLDDAITYKINAPIDNVYSVNNTIGVLNSVLDNDSAIRQVQPIFKLVKDGKTYYMPSLAFAGFLKYYGEGDKIIIKKNKIFYKNKIIPVDESGLVSINRHNLSHGYSYIPISSILLNKGGKDELKPGFFKGKIVVIGKTATGGLIDLRSIVDQSYSTPEINAAAIDNFINDSVQGKKNQEKFISETSKPVEFVLTLFACIIAALLGLVPKSAFMGFFNGFLSIIAYISFSFLMFVNPASRVLIPMVVPLYYLAVTSGVVFAFRFYKEMTRKASIMNVFGKFVSPKVLSVVMKNPDKMILKNTKKRITILFCDVKNFSTLCEQHDPEQLISSLNDLFKEIVNIIFNNNGTVDKFIGDCIMAYWGDFVSCEEDSYLAVKTALEIKAKVEELKLINAKANKISFDVKIGINTGEAVLGLAGTDKIMNYTAMGDAVNVASRLESSCSRLNRSILISKSTYQEVEDKIKADYIGEIEVKGKNEKVEVYEPLDIHCEPNAQAQKETELITNEK